MSLLFSIYLIIMRFSEWIANRNVGSDEVTSQIDSVYDKAKYAIKIVQMYSKATGKKLLNNISTIAPLNSGVYGLYNSSENKRVINPIASGKIKFKFGEDFLKSHNINTLPQKVIKQYLPEIPEDHIAPSDVIHVNVAKIVRDMGDTPKAVIEIAKTIVHEAIHEIEFHTKGSTDETGPKKAEMEFEAWINANWNSISAKMPQLKF